MLAGHVKDLVIPPVLTPLQALASGFAPFSAAAIFSDAVVSSDPGSPEPPYQVVPAGSPSLGATLVMSILSRLNNTEIFYTQALTSSLHCGARQLEEAFSRPAVFSSRSSSLI